MSLMALPTMWLSLHPPCGEMNRPCAGMGDLVVLEADVVLARGLDGRGNGHMLIVAAYPLVLGLYRSQFQPGMSRCPAFLQSSFGSSCSRSFLSISQFE